MQTKRQDIGIHKANLHTISSGHKKCFRLFAVSFWGNKTMDYLEKGKKLAQDGNFEEALDAFLLALENDKENADLHFYLGLSYSSLEQFPYAKYHYEIAIRLDPNHKKTKLVWDGIKHITPEKPPEKRLTRSAEAKARQSQTQIQDSKPATAQVPENHSVTEKKTDVQLTDDKWERAFPADEIIHHEKDSSFVKNFFIFVIGTTIVASIVYFVLSLFLQQQ